LRPGRRSLPNMASTAITTRNRVIALISIAQSP
jgi:hypothetical protein